MADLQDDLSKVIDYVRTHPLVVGVARVMFNFGLVLLAALAFSLSFGQIVAVLGGDAEAVKTVESIIMVLGGMAGFIAALVFTVSQYEK